MTRRSFGDADLNAYLDGEMPVEEQADFEAWLAENPAERQRLAAYRADLRRLHEALDPVLDEAVPESIMAALNGARRRRLVWWQAAAAIVIFTAGGGAGWSVAQLAGPSPAIGQSTAERALTAHRVYVSEVLHPVEVGADQKTHLVGWLSKRLGHRLSAPDLAESGFNLVGGRLLPGADGAAAQIMYEDRQGERVTLYVAVNPKNAKTAFKLAKRGQTETFYWLDGPLGYALAGDIGEERLLILARIVYGGLMGGEES